MWCLLRLFFDTRIDISIPTCSATASLPPPQCDTKHLVFYTPMSILGNRMLRRSNPQLLRSSAGLIENYVFSQPDWPLHGAQHSSAIAEEDSSAPPLLRRIDLKICVFTARLATPGAQLPCWVERSLACAPYASVCAPL